ncbi:PDR/VanB family oxidoreductase [Cupriavidus sp. WKF15]|uniref:PDR/VanB family oxidoreductase n=1 Tax=Cupriavidus sp. WKF15 TaxID=3032282 RepID=UPI0023E1D852|nr:PDR/VanB family oxidoreductase [Cupriavidus sp. WKF15]WER48010.1 PDR/VanB family oxidoreductase [Cupriavidus sp. WKF15]
MNDTLRVRVGRIEQLAAGIKRFTLQPCDGDALPAFESGSHIVVHMDNGRYRNAYSLTSALNDDSRYQISVRLEEASRGGSRFLHESVREHDELEIGRPGNLFALHQGAGKHLLIAGGIGITPFMTHIQTLKRQGAAFELHYCFRNRASAAFLDTLPAMLSPGQWHQYESDTGVQLDIAVLIANQPADAHVYVCGPSALNDAVINAARAAGWDASRIHFEQFRNEVDATGGAFEVTLRKSGLTLQVGPDDTLLRVIEKAGVKVECMCREGICGTCETAIIEGEADHRDNYLCDEEKAAQKTIMLCVSRSKAQRLVLDL